jgi:hypothetical protein
MYIYITENSAELAEPHDVTKFAVICPDHLEHDQIEARVRQQGLGELLPGGGHLMVSVDAIRQMASGRVGPGWPADFAKMIDFAAGKGWTSEDRSQVRAHIERVSRDV